MSDQRTVYIVDGARTPFLKARGKPGPFTPVDLAVQCGRPLLMRQPFGPDAFDQVILGCVNTIADEQNPGRVAALRLGCGASMVAFTVAINCGSGMQSIDTAYRCIREGKSNLILAGGAESLSHAPLVFGQDFTVFMGAMNMARTAVDRAKVIATFRPEMLTPIVGLEHGLTDPVVELGMGQTAEVLAHLFHISREEGDAYAVESHHRLADAQKSGFLDGEVELAFSTAGEVFDHDDGVRPDSAMDKLAKLKPVFERPYGKVTAGNSSQITDGASWVILASEEAVKEHGLTPLARIVDSEWQALDPSIMGLGPVMSSSAILKRQNKRLQDVDLWELNEAFAHQVLACVRAWADADFCQRVLGLDGPMGDIDMTRLNVDGGAVSLGHPVGASGNRIVLHAINASRRLGLKTSIATECIGGGQGGAMLLETV